MTSGPRTRGLAPTREVLPNGLTVIAREANTTPAITIHAAVLAGPVYEPPGADGLAHFVSKTIDRGTSRQTGDQIAEELDSRGVTLAISVNRHAITLVCTCLVEDFDQVLALLGDILITPTFPDAEVATRRKEIATLIAQEEDNPASVASQALLRTLYGAGHPYGRLVRGTAESIERIDSGTLRQFHARQFAPAAVSLALVGDISPERAVASAARVFGGWGGGARVEPDLRLPPQATSRRVEVRPMMNKAQADVAYGFTTILRADPRYYAYRLMNHVLGEYSLGGRLGDSIRERQGMAYYAFSALDANVIPGPLIIRAGVSPSNVERAVASIDEELKTMAAGGPTDKELAESKQYLVGSMPRNLETNVGIANFLQMAEFFGLGTDYDLRMPGLLQAVTRDDVHQAARDVLDPGRAAVSVAGPYDGPLS